MLKRLRDEERGVAMIMALAVAFVVLLTTVVVAQSIHSLDSSGYDRERLLSINAAGPGRTTGTPISRSPRPRTWRPTPDATPGPGSSRSPTSSSRDRRAAFDSTGRSAADGTTAMSCATFSDTNFPST